MNVQKITAVLSAALVAASLLSLASCGKGDSEGSTPDTYGETVHYTESGAEVRLRDGISKSDYPADTNVGAWLAGCSVEDRNDHFEAYTLRHAQPAEDGNTTFTYFIYYPRGGMQIAAMPELLEGDGGYVINIRYAEEDEGVEYSLCSLSVTIPTEKSPRLRLLVGEETIGVLSTVTDTVILGDGE